MSKTYDPEIASAAAELWEKLATHEGEDADAQLIIEAALRPLFQDRERLMFLWSLLSDPHGYGLRATWIEHRASVQIANDFGLVLADVDMEEDEDDTEDEKGRTWREAIDQAREKLATLKEGPGGYRPRRFHQ